jgi:hypothetical protein
MDVDLDAAIEFLAGHARLLDRRRLCRVGFTTRPTTLRSSR